MTTKIFESQEQEPNDPILEEIASATRPVNDKIDKSEDHALFVLGVKYLDSDEKPDLGVQTFLSASGYFGIIAEGLYAELADQIESGQMSLFAMLREVIRDIEEDFEIDPDDELDDNEGTRGTLH